METGVLQITVLKGPKRGEILVCKPGSKLQIGRIMKGNDFSLRDPGISQTHLCFKFDSEASRWFVSDLDSSNGTILNGSMIQSSLPVPISDEDVISIGEKTQLGVSVVPIVLLEGKKEENGDVNARRVNSRTEEPDKKGGGVQLRRNPRRGNSSKALKEIDINCAVSVEAKGVRTKRKGRGKAKEDENSDPDCVIISDEGKGFKARTRPRVNSSIVTEEENGKEDIGVKEGLEVNGNEVSMVTGEEKVGDDIGVKEGLEVNGNEVSMVTGEEKGVEDIGVKEGLEVNGNEVGDFFETMTLDQWFDSMYIFLPKVIYDESEKIINILKEKAKKFDELIEAGGDV